MSGAIAKAEELIRAGEAEAALGALQEAVRGDAGNARLRVFLFQLLCVLGDWKRAIAQLRLCAELDAEALPMAQTYREAIICEVFREKVFAGDRQPLILGEPQDWLALLVEALARPDRAADLRARAFDMAPATGGLLNDRPFAWISDADMRLGPVLEAVIDGKYYWVPFSAIAHMTIEPPVDLRDTVWMPATLVLATGGESVALIPTRYPGTVVQGSGAERLSRATRWIEADPGTHVGCGQRLFVTDCDEIALMDVRTLVLAPGDRGEADG